MWVCHVSRPRTYLKLLLHLDNLCRELGVLVSDIFQARVKRVNVAAKAVKTGAYVLSGVRTRIGGRA